MGDVKRCTLPDDALRKAVQEWVSKLCDTGGRAWTLSVPVNFNRDPDMLISELCNRQATLLARHNALGEAVNEYLELTDKSDAEYLALVDKTPGLTHRIVAARAEVDRLIGGE